jgi:hypothetical protein
LERPDIQTILIICPLVIKAQWVEAITTLVKEAGSPIVMVDDLLSRTPIIEEFRNVEEQNGSAPFRVWVIAHYEQFINKSSARPVFDRGWHLVIVVRSVATTDGASVAHRCGTGLRISGSL